MTSTGASRPRQNGAAIRGLRQRRGWKVSELARRVQVSRSHLSNVEGGRLPASIELLHRIATELSVPVAKLLATDDESDRAAS